MHSQLNMSRVFTQTFVVAAAIIERDGKILLVHESQKKHPDNGKWSHPAGWIDVGENPIDTAVRETKEETGHDFIPKSVIGIYSLVRSDIKKELGATPHAIKIAFGGDISDLPASKLADDVSETRWFSPEEIYAMDNDALRDVDIKQIVKNYLAGKVFPLGVITHTIQV